MDKKAKFKALRGKARKRFGKVIANEIRRRRTQYGCSQEAVCAQIGCHRNLIIQIEKRRVLPPLDTLYVILNGIERLNNPKKADLNWRQVFSDFFTYHRPIAATTEEDERAEQLHEQLAAIIAAKNERDVATVANVIEDKYKLMLQARARGSPELDAG